MKLHVRIKVSTINLTEKGEYVYQWESYLYCIQSIL